MDALKSKGQMYDQIDLQKIPHSGFDLSYDCKGTGSLGRLYPVRCMNTLPGDRFKGSSQIAVQFQPLAVPMLSNMHMRSETFYVPNRLLWKNWESFIYGGQQLDDVSVPPTITFKSCFESLFSGLYDLNQSLLKVAIQCGTVKYAFLDDEVHYYSGYKYDIYQKVTPGSTLSTAIVGRYNVCLNIDYLLKSLVSFRDDFVSLMKDSNIYDLALDSLSALDSLVSYVSALDIGDDNRDTFLITGDSSIDNMYDYRLLPVFDVSDTAVRTLDQLKNGSSFGDKDMDLLIPYFVSVFGSIDPDKPIYIAPLSTEYRQVMQYLYDFMRPFIGLGSNLDMLGYHCLKFSDMLFMCYQTWFSEVAPFTNYGSVAMSTGMTSGVPVFSQFFLKSSDSPNANMLVDRLRALYSIWYNYYRDQVLEADVLEPSLDDNVTDDELIQLLAPRRRCWAKDTFTTALDNTGTGSVVVPVTDKVLRNATQIKSFDSLTADTADTASAKLENMDIVSYTLTSGETIQLPSRYIGTHSTGVTSLSADASAFSLDVMKRAQRVQKWIQKALIYGNRPQDALFTHFGVRYLDERLQLPEYLCGDSQMCRLDTLVNNTTTSESVAGDKAANAYGYTDGQTLNRFCEEHGLIITLFSVMPSSEYGYGVCRDLRRVTRFDYAWPEFADLGMDGVLAYELCDTPVNLGAVHVTNSTYKQPDVNTVFGYQGRYYDYKSKQNEIHGDLQTTDDMYTFARKFNPYDPDSMPKLNRYFVHCRPRLDMFISDYPLDDQFRFDIHHSQAVERCLPVPSQFL